MDLLAIGLVVFLLFSMRAGISLVKVTQALDSRLLWRPVSLPVPFLPLFDLVFGDHWLDIIAE